MHYDTLTTKTINSIIDKELEDDYDRYEYLYEYFYNNWCTTKRLFDWDDFFKPSPQDESEYEIYFDLSIYIIDRKE